MLLQAITMDDRAYPVEKASKSFIRTYVFPGGCLPSLEVISRCVVKRTDLRTIHLEDLTPHYAETLRRWRTNFEAATERLEALGYDERFRRLWRMYLSYCEAGFAEQPDRARADGVRQAARRVGHARGGAAAGYVRGCRLNIRPADRVKHEGRAARGELGVSRAAAGAEDVTVVLDGLEQLVRPLGGLDLVPAGGVHVAAVDRLGGVEHVGVDARG